MGYLDGHPARVGDQSAQGSGETQQVGYVPIDVVYDYQVRGAMFGAHSGCQSLVEKGRDRRHTAVAGSCADICRRLDPQARYARGDDMLQQIAVIAADFDHKGLDSKLQPPDGLIDKILSMLDPGLRKGGKMRV